MVGAMLGTGARLCSGSVAAQPCGFVEDIASIEDTAPEPPCALQPLCVPANPFEVQRTPTARCCPAPVAAEGLLGFWSVAFPACFKVSALLPRLPLRPPIPC